MIKALNIYILLELGVLVLLLIISLVFWDKRYRKNHGASIPAGFVKTEEITVDPGNGKRLRVYYNPDTGERFYHEEDKAGHTPE